MFNGMVLLIQVTSDNQWQGWDSQFYVHAWKHGWPGTVEAG